MRLWRPPVQTLLASSIVTVLFGSPTESLFSAFHPFSEPIAIVLFGSPTESLFSAFVCGFKTCQKRVMVRFRTAVEDCATIVSKLSLNSVKVTCKRWDRNPQTQFARGYFTASGHDDPGGQIVPEIILLPERIFGGEGEIREILRHEMVHAFDHSVLKRDLRSSTGLACSEIRAAREAECQQCSTNPFIRATCRIMPTRMCERWREECVREVATKATEAAFPKQIATVSVSEMFSECYEDRQGFDQV
ncbi:hypothetical protein BASA81_001913 [Batrachochytrium salamandrivorans]|nr:hypothetical protein BASA81_001913 [Batrachochytrium salamandrivorans]